MLHRVVNVTLAAARDALFGDIVTLDGIALL